MNMRCIFHIAFDWSCVFQITDDILSSLWNFKFYIAFVLSYAFQITGAILLLLWSLKGIQKNIFDLYFSESSFVERDDNNMCTLHKERLQKETRTVVLNIAAFSDIIVGYLLAIVGEQQFSNQISFLSIIGLTVIISLLEYAIAFLISKFKYPEDVKISYDHLLNRDILTNPTNQEISDAVTSVYKEVFGADD